MDIHEYASQGDCDRVRKELRNRVAVDARDERDYTPLACAVSSPQAGEDMLRLLIEAGADLNRAVEEGRHFPLELAACSGSFGKAQCLLDAGADIKQVLPKGYTVLINVAYALHNQVALVPMIEWLVQHGAEIDCKSEYGESPLSVMSRKIEPVKSRGDHPGWIYKHKARLESSSSLVISEGTICREFQGEEQHDANQARYRLDLNEMQWTRL